MELKYKFKIGQLVASRFSDIRWERPLLAHIINRGYLVEYGNDGCHLFKRFYEVSLIENPKEVRQYPEENLEDAT